MFRSIFTMLMFAAVLCGSAGAATWQVYPDGRGETPTIQSAIDSAAASGDGIYIWAGSYQEDGIVIDGKSIFVQSSGTAVLSPTISGAGTGLVIRNCPAGTLVMGLEMREFETGVSIEHCSPTVWYCGFFDCSTGISVLGASSAPEISFCPVSSCATGIHVWGGSGVSIRNLTIVGCGTGFESAGSPVSFSRNIIDSCATGILLSGGSLSLSCNDVYLCTVPYSGCAAGPGDMSQMPRFCFDAGSPEDPYLLHSDSPCWAENNSCGVDMGAFTNMYGCVGTPVRETSWGGVKSLYR